MEPLLVGRTKSSSRGVEAVLAAPCPWNLTPGESTPLRRGVRPCREAAAPLGASVLVAQVFQCASIADRIRGDVGRLF